MAGASMQAYFEWEAPTEVIADASPVGLGEVDGECRAVCYASRSLNNTRYSRTEKKALVLVWSCEGFNLNLYGLPEIDLVTENHLWPNLKAIRANRALGVVIATFQLQSSLCDLQGEHCGCSVLPN